MQGEETKAQEQKQKEVFVDVKTQQELNQPLNDPTGLNATNREFLKLIIKLIDSREVDPMVPSSFLNEAVYAGLGDAARSEVDLEAMNMAVAVRQIEDLYRAEIIETFQMDNLLERLRNTKERLEKASGDVFKL